GFLRVVAESLASGLLQARAERQFPCAGLPRAKAEASRRSRKRSAERVPRPRSGSTAMERIPLWRRPGPDCLRQLSALAWKVLRDLARPSELFAYVLLARAKPDNRRRRFAERLL